MVRARAKKVTPGGVNSPVRAFGSVGGTPLVIRSAAGALITDVRRPRVSRLRRLVGAADLGPRARDDRRGRRGRVPARHVVRRAVHSRRSSSPRGRRALIRRSSRCASCRRAPRPSMSAVRLARGATGRDLVVKFSGCYHGHVDYLLVAAGSGLATFGQPSSQGVPKELAALTRVLPLDDAAAAEKLFAAEGDRHRRRHHRARAGQQRPAAAATRVLEDAARALHEARRAADLRRGHHRLSRRRRAAPRRTTRSSRTSRRSARSSAAACPSAGSAARARS